MKKETLSFKVILRLALLLFITTTVFGNLFQVSVSYAAEIILPAPNSLLELSANFNKATLKGLKIDPKNPLKIKFIVDSADQTSVESLDSQRLVNYFLAAVTVPEEDLWVNLSPYENDRIVPDALGVTKMGEDLLAQDYVLKQLSSSLSNPDTELGKKYWEQNLSDNFNKIWIVPKRADIYENGNFVFITDSTLDIKTENDYLAEKENGVLSKDSSSVKDILLPKIREELNRGENFSTVRQIYNSLILGLWFKAKVKDSFYKHYINSNKVDGIDIEDKSVKDKIWDLYCESFEKGVYNLVKKDYQKKQKRTFFSGGFDGSNAGSVVRVVDLAVTDLAGYTQGTLHELEINLESASSSLTYEELNGEKILKESYQGLRFELQQKVAHLYPKYFFAAQSTLSTYFSSLNKKKSKRKDKLDKKIQRELPNNTLLTRSEEFELMMYLYDFLDQKTNEEIESATKNKPEFLSLGEKLNKATAKKYFEYGNSQLWSYANEIAKDKSSFLSGPNEVVYSFVNSFGGQLGGLSHYLSFYDFELNKNNLEELNEVSRRFKEKISDDEFRNGIVEAVSFYLIGKLYDNLYDSRGELKVDFNEVLSRRWFDGVKSGSDLLDELSSSDSLINAGLEHIIDYFGAEQMGEITMLFNTPFEVEIFQKVSQILGKDELHNENFISTDAIGGQRKYDNVYLRVQDSFDGILNIVDNFLAEQGKLSLNGSVADNNVKSFVSDLWQEGIRSQIYISSESQSIENSVRNKGMQYNVVISGINVGKERIKDIFDLNIVDSGNFVSSKYRTARLNTNTKLDKETQAQLRKILAKTVATPVDMWHSDYYDVLSSPTPDGSMRIVFDEPIMVDGRSFSGVYVLGTDFSAQALRESSHKRMLTNESLSEHLAKISQLKELGLETAVPLAWGNYTNDALNGYGFLAIGIDESFDNSFGLKYIEQDYRIMNDAIASKAKMSKNNQEFDSFAMLRQSVDKHRDGDELIKKLAQSVLQSFKAKVLPENIKFFSSGNNRPVYNDFDEVNVYEQLNPETFYALVKNFKGLIEELFAAPNFSSFRELKVVDWLSVYLNEFSQGNVDFGEYEALDKVINDLDSVLEMSEFDVYLSDNIVVKTLRDSLGLKIKAGNSGDGFNLDGVKVLTVTENADEIQHISSNQDEYLLLTADARKKIVDNFPRQKSKLNSSKYRILRQDALATIYKIAKGDTTDLVVPDFVKDLFPEFNVSVDTLTVESNQALEAKPTTTEIIKPSAVDDNLNFNVAVKRNPNVVKLGQLNYLFDANWREASLAYSVDYNMYQSFSADLKEAEELMGYIELERDAIENSYYEKSLLRMHNMYMTMAEFTAKLSDYDDVKLWIDKWYDNFAKVNFRRGVVHATAVFADLLRLNQDKIRPILEELSSNREDLVSLLIKSFLSLNDGHLSTTRDLVDQIIEKSVQVPELSSISYRQSRAKVEVMELADRLIRSLSLIENGGSVKELDTYSFHDSEMQNYASSLRKINLYLSEKVKTLQPKLNKRVQQTAELEQVKNAELDSMLLKLKRDFKADKKYRSDFPAYYIVNYLRDYTNLVENKDARKWLSSIKLVSPAVVNMMDLINDSLWDNEEKIKFWEIFSININDMNKLMNDLQDRSFSDKYMLFADLVLQNKDKLSRLFFKANNDSMIKFFGYEYLDKFMETLRDEALYDPDDFDIVEKIDSLKIEQDKLVDDWDAKKASALIAQISEMGVNYNYNILADLILDISDSMENEFELEKEWDAEKLYDMLVFAAFLINVDKNNSIGFEAIKHLRVNAFSEKFDEIEIEGEVKAKNKKPTRTIFSNDLANAFSSSSLGVTPPLVMFLDAYFQGYDNTDLFSEMFNANNEGKFNHNDYSQDQIVAFNKIINLKALVDEHIAHSELKLTELSLMMDKDAALRERVKTIQAAYDLVKVIKDFPSNVDAPVNTHDILKDVLLGNMLHESFHTVNVIPLITLTVEPLVEDFLVGDKKEEVLAHINRLKALEAKYNDFSAIISLLKAEDLGKAKANVWLSLLSGWKDMFEEISSQMKQTHRLLIDNYDLLLPGEELSENDVIRGVATSLRYANNLVDDIDAIMNQIADFETNKPVSVAKVISDKTKYYIDHGTIEYDITIQQDAKVFSQPIKLGIVLQNFISNSIYAINERNKNEKSKDYNGVINILLFERDGSLVLSFRDNGIGMKKETLENNWLYKEGNTTKGSEGTGVGMAYVKKLLDEMGAKIEVRSEYGKGTAFKVTFPIAQELAAASSSLNSDLGGVDFRGVDLNVSSSGLPIEIEAIDPVSFKGFAFKVLSFKKIDNVEETLLAYAG